jgi:hypothetical protein
MYWNCKIEALSCLNLFRYEDPALNRMMVIYSNTIDSCFEVARNSSVTIFALEKGFYLHDDLSLLLPYKEEIKGLDINIKMKLTHLKEFTNLEWLVITGMNEAIDFSFLPNLKCLLLCENKKVKNLNALKNLKALELRGNYGDDLSNIQEMESLEKLHLLWSKVKSLNGIGQLKQLKNLEVEARYLIDIGDIEGAINLESVQLSGCKNLNTNVDLSKLKNLDFLILYHVGAIENVKFLSALPNMREFRFFDTNVVDGDLSPCFNVKETVAFIKKSHYSHTEKEIMKKINERKIGKIVQNTPIETYKLPYFDDISINPLEDCEVAEEVCGISIGLSLQFYEPTISKEQLEKTKHLLERIETIYQTAQKYVDDDFGKKGKVDEYIKDVIDCMDKDELAGIIQNADKKLSKKQQVFSCVHISVIHIHPHEDCRMNIYYTIEEGWDGILTIRMDADGTITDVAIES